MADKIDNNDTTINKQAYVGIDYGAYAGSNRNAATGIHYGVISQWSLNPDVINDVVMEGADYGEPHCRKCGESVSENNEENQSHIEHVEDCETPDDTECDCLTFENYTKHGCADYICFGCRHTLDSSEVYSEEMLGWSYDADGYKLQDCLNNDVFVSESPYYTYAQFCSPCVPGAGNLDNPIEPCERCYGLDVIPNPHATDYEQACDQPHAPKTYCLGHDWFEDNRAPYRVFKVVDDTEVQA